MTHRIIEPGCRVAWTCGECGEKYGEYVGGVHTWHEGTCGVCGAEHVGVCAVRLFRYLPGYACRCDRKAGQ